MKNSTPTTEAKTTHIMPVVPEYVRAESLSAIEALPKDGVDRENGIIRGKVIAQAGPLKSRRGEFDETSLRGMVEVINSLPKGLKSRFTHPSLSDDGLGKFLGRDKNARLDTVMIERDGQTVPLLAVRADLHFNPTALDTPVNGGKPLGTYIMDLAESDPDALSSSVVIPYEGLTEEWRKDENGKPLKDAAGNELPPLWRVSKLHASDIVDTGDAVDGLLSAELPDDAVRRGCELLDRVFHDQPLEVVRSRVLSWFQKYVDLRYPGESLDLTGETEELKKQIEELGADKTHLLGVVAELQERLQKSNAENEALRFENIQQEVEKVFDQELQGKVKSGERPRLLQAAINLRKQGNGPDSEFRIFIESLKARESKDIDLKEFAGNAGHSITIDITRDPQEEKQEVSGFLMP